MSGDIPRSLLDAPLDDEPETPEEAALVEEARQCVARGEVIADVDLDCAIVLTDESWEVVQELMRNPPKPSEALRRLFADRMPVIYADFNARTEDDRVRLTTVGSRRSLAKTPVAPGESVWLFDGEMKVRAVVETSATGKLLARVDWSTAVDVEWAGREKELVALIDKELAP